MITVRILWRKASKMFALIGSSVPVFLHDDTGAAWYNAPYYYSTVI